MDMYARLVGQGNSFFYLQCYCSINSGAAICRVLYLVRVHRRWARSDPEVGKRPRSKLWAGRDLKTVEHTHDNSEDKTALPQPTPPSQTTGVRRGAAPPPSRKGIFCTASEKGTIPPAPLFAPAPLHSH
jgi:hypothetical protein